MVEAPSLLRLGERGRQCVRRVWRPIMGIPPMPTMLLEC